MDLFFRHKIFFGPIICLGLGNFHWRWGIKLAQAEHFRLKSCWVNCCSRGITGPSSGVVWISFGLPGVVVSGVWARVARGGLSGPDRGLNISQLFLVKSFPVGNHRIIWAIWELLMSLPQSSFPVDKFSASSIHNWD